MRVLPRPMRDSWQVCIMLCVAYGTGVNQMYIDNNEVSSNLRNKRGKE